MKPTHNKNGNISQPKEAWYFLQNTDIIIKFKNQNNETPQRKPWFVRFQSSAYRRKLTTSLGYVINRFRGQLPVLTLGASSSCERDTLWKEQRLALINQRWSKQLGLPNTQNNTLEQWFLTGRTNLPKGARVLTRTYMETFRTVKCSVQFT